MTPISAKALTMTLLFRGRGYQALVGLARSPVFKTLAEAHEWVDDEWAKVVDGGDIEMMPVINCGLYTGWTEL